MNQSRPRKQSQPQLIHDESSRSQLFINDSIHRGSTTSIEDDRMSRAESVKDMDENIRVFVRVKPDLKTDPNPYNYSLSETYLKVKDNNTINIHNSTREVVKSFSYEYILNEKYKQEEVFMISTAPLIKHAIMGYNSTIFVYGQTGSGTIFRVNLLTITGKTYTMGMLNQLNESSNGVLPLSLKYLFEYFEEVKQREEENYNWDLSVSLIQIYLDNIMDLLNPKGDYLQIREDPETKETYLQDLVNVPVENLQQTMLLINAGLAARTQAAQRMNQTSSRSHLVMMFNIRQEFIDTNNKRTQLFSQLTMIDLAGSERVRKTISSGLRLEEAKFINSSLNALGNVISALQNPNKPFIPYRASKLTRILQNSLNGDAKIALIATISKASSNINETISTLQFASRCREIQLKPQINYLQHDDSEEEATETESQAPSENQQSVKEFNYESESVMTKNNQLLQQQKEYSELLGYVFELIPTLKKYVIDKIPDIHSIRENYISEILEELKNKVKIEDLHMNEAETQIYLKNQELLDELDKIYPVLPQEMPHEEDEDDLTTITGKSPNQLLNIIQKAARPIIDHMNCLVQNSINFEKLKLHFIKREAKFAEMEDQIEQLIKLTQKLLKSNKTLYGQNIEMKYPNVTLDDRLKLLNQHNQDLLNLIKGQLNIRETRVANQSEILDKILAPSFSDSAKKVKLKSPLGTGLQDYYENIKAASNTSINPTQFDTQEPQKIEKNQPNLSTDPVAAISVLQNLKTDFIENAIKETHEDKPEIDSSADESISFPERVSTTGPENSNLRVLTNMSDNNPPSVHDKPKKYYIGDGNPQKRIDRFDNTLQISENTRDLSHLLASGKGKENIPNESFEVSMRVARNQVQELPDITSKRDSFRYFSHKDQDQPKVDGENSLQEQNEPLNIEKVTKKPNKKPISSELSAYEKILQRKNLDNNKQGLRSSRTSSQSKTKDSGNYSSLRDSKATANENKFSSVKSDKPNLPVPAIEISKSKNSQQFTIPLPLPLNDKEVSLGKQSQSFAPVESMRSSKLSIEGPRNSKRSNFESLQRETITKEEERKTQTFANLSSERQQTIQDSIISLSKPTVKSGDPLPARIPKNNVFHTHQTLESQSSLLVSDKRSERKNTHENNYFSLSIKEANSIMKDELSEPAANASPLRLKESSYFAGATIATAEKPEMAEYWSFSKKEAEIQSKIQPPHQEYEDLTERIENLDISLLNKTGDERKTININDISKIPNLASYQKEHEDEKSVQFFLKQISPFKEGKSLAEIHQRTVSPHHSHNLSVDSSNVKTQNYLTVDKLNKKRLREYNNRFFSQKKSFSSHPVKRHDTTIGNMSLEELSVSIEKINPRKYEGDVSPSALAKAEGLGDKSFDEIIPTSMKKIYEDKKENDPYIEYVAESYKSRKKSPIDRYIIQDKILNFENKPVIPRITKVVNELDSSKEEPSSNRKRSLSSKLGVRWGKIFDWKKDKTKNIYKDKFNS